MKIIKFTNSRKWNNKRTFYLYDFGLLSLGIKGLLVDVIIKRQKFKQHCERLIKMGIQKSSSTFPFNYHDIF